MEVIARNLVSSGILPWFDKWEIQPGTPVAGDLEGQIRKAKAAAIFIGSNGLGDWQQLEMRSLITKLAKKKIPVIPVFLPNAPGEMELPSLLDTLSAVDFRKSDPAPPERLIWGITGKNAHWSSQGILRNR